MIEQFKHYVAENMNQFTIEEVRWFYEKFKTQYLINIALKHGKTYTE